MKIDSILLPIAGLALILTSGCGNQSTSGIQGEVDFLDQADLFTRPIRGQAPAFDPKTTIALVDGAPISREEFDREVQLRVLNLQQKVPADQLQQLVPRIQEEALEMLIIRRLLNEAVESEQISVTSEEVEASLATLRASVESSTSWDEFIETQNTTTTAIRARLSNQLKLERLLKQRVPDVAEPTDEKVEAFYTENPARFQVPDLAGVSHLLLLVPADASEADRDIAVRKAEKLRDAAVDKGVAFEKIVERYSEDDASKERKGTIGMVKRGQLPPELDEAAFSLGVGEISGPLRSDFGVHLLRVDSRENARTLALEEVAEQIRAGLKEQARQEGLQTYIKSLVKEADVVLPSRATPEGSAAP